MHPLSNAARNALLRSHGMDVRCRVVGPLGSTDYLAVAGGEVVVDTDSEVRRTATLAADPRLWPASPYDLLSPWGSEISVDYGIVLPDTTTEWVPVGVFALASNRRDLPQGGDGSLTLKLVDRSRRIARDKPGAPFQTISGATGVSEIARIARITYPGLTVVDYSGSTQVVPQIEIAEDPWVDGIGKIATGLGLECFFDATGNLVIRNQTTLSDPPVWEIVVGEQGNLLGYTEEISHEQVVNRVTVRARRADGTAPASATATDTDPASPTRWDGPMGRAPKTVDSDVLTTAAQCQTAADALLAAYKGTGVTVDMQALVNPALDGGDVITRRTATTAAHRVIRTTIPLSPDGAQTVDARSTELPAA